MNEKLSKAAEVTGDRATYSVPVSLRELEVTKPTGGAQPVSIKSPAPKPSPFPMSGIRTKPARKLFSPPLPPPQTPIPPRPRDTDEIPTLRRPNLALVKMDPPPLSTKAR